jgi:hypothetical protein
MPARSRPTGAGRVEHSPSNRLRFAVTRSRALLCRLLTEHAPDDARQQLAARVVEHLEAFRFEIDEAEQVMRKRPPPRNHG